MNMRNLEQLNQELTQLTKAEKEFRELLTINRLRQQEIKEAKFLLESGLMIGDEVMYNGKRGKFTGFTHRYSEPKPQFTPYNKDGSLSVRSTDVWGWGGRSLEKITETPAK